MGTKVLKIEIVDNTNLRYYAHCSNRNIQVENSVTVVLINADSEEEVSIDFPTEQFGK